MVVSGQMVAKMLVVALMPLFQGCISGLEPNVRWHLDVSDALMGCLYFTPPLDEMA